MTTDLHSIFATQRAGFTAELPVSLAVRKDRLQRLVTLLKDNAEAFAQALSADFGHRSREQSLISDISSGLGQCRHALAHIGKWSRPEARKLPLPLRLMGARGWIEYQPKGVVGIIVPWNFPIQLSIGPVAGAFAAGNRCMVKSSEITPQVAALFEQLAPKYFDASELAFISGGPESGQAFAALPFDHLIFTGATNIGRHILHAAANNLTPVTLELGGKSPAIIGKNADIARAAGRITMGKMLNAGQICLAPDYVFAPPAQLDEIVGGIKTAAAEMYPTLLANPDYTSVINERHHVRLASYLDDARAKGAEVIEVNPGGENFAGANVNKMPLYIIRNATDDMRVMQEEIFGPILPVQGYNKIDDAIDYINAHGRPLGLYYFGADETEQRQILDRTISGGVTLNDVMFHAGMDDLPFGGVGPSGMGSYHGIDGFRTFSHAKAVYKQGRIDLAKLSGMRPPYGKATHATIARALKA